MAAVQPGALATGPDVTNKQNMVITLPLRVSVWIAGKKTATFALYNINRLVFTSDVECLLRGSD
jgi:hypothetical protein